MPHQAVAYMVAATFADAGLADQWIAWLREGHVQQVIAGGATDAEIIRMDGPGHVVEVRYRFPDRKAFAAYEQNHAPRLRAEGMHRFPPSRGIAYERSVGVVEFESDVGRTSTEAVGDGTNR